MLQECYTNQKAPTVNPDKCLILLTRQGGLEPPAYGLEVIAQINLRDSPELHTIPHHIEIFSVFTFVQF